MEETSIDHYKKKRKARTRRGAREREKKTLAKKRGDRDRPKQRNEQSK